MKYWLLEWLNKNKIHSDQDLQLIHFDRELIRKMASQCDDWHSEHVALDNSQDYLFAGTGLDIGGDYCCTNYDCIAKVVDKQFRHAWHYFDKIIIRDVTTLIFKKLVYEFDNSNTNSELDESYLFWLVSVMRLLIHLECINAIELVEFVPNYDPDVSKIKIAFYEDVKNVEKIDSILREEFLTEGKFSLYKYEESSYVTMSTKLLNVQPCQLVLENDCSNYHRTIDKLISTTINDIHEVYFKDFCLTHHFNACLGSSFAPSDVILKYTGGVGQNSFYIELPNIDNIPLDQLMRIRNNEREAFVRFKNALKRALKLNATVVKEKITNEIYSDIVRPELANLSLKLKSAQSSLKRKTMVSIGLGAIGTTCGLLMGGSDVVAGLAGIAPLLTASAGAGAKYIDDISELKSSEMYFLWKALGHSE